VGIVWFFKLRESEKQMFTFSRTHLLLESPSEHLIVGVNWLTILVQEEDLV
jgi:hypothetical protein